MKKPAYLTEETLKTFILSALNEDLQGGDHSTLATIPENLIQKKQCLLKEDCVVAGIELAEMIFKTLDPSIKMDALIPDGKTVKAGAIAFIVRGKAQSITQAERLVLNCMQRMSGIATLTQEWDSRLVGTKTRLLDTRKTTPNFRVCEKWAVAIGGGSNHRNGLSDMIVLEDLHIDHNGSLTKAVKKAKDYLKKNKLNLKVSVKTRNLSEVEEALKAKVDRITLNHTDLSFIKKAVTLINGKIETEASGDLTRDQLKDLAATGVSFISAGGLTQYAKTIAIDLESIE